VGGVAREVGLQALHGIGEGAEVAEPALAAGSLDGGEEAVADLVAGEACVLIGRVFAPGDAFTAEDLVHFLTAHINERSNDGELAGAERELDGGLQGGEAFQGGPPEPAHQQGLKVVICVVAGEDAASAKAIRLLSQRSVACSPSARFEPRRVRVEMDPAADEGDPSLCAEAGAKGRVSVALLTPQSVVDMHCMDHGARLGAMGELKEEDAVCAPGEGDQDGILRVEAYALGEACVATVPGGLSGARGVCGKLGAHGGMAPQGSLIPSVGVVDLFRSNSSKYAHKGASRGV